MRTLHLFAGGGGGLYADLILGHTPIAAVEWDPWACAALRSAALLGWFPGLRVHEIDARLFDPSEYAGRVDCINAGFPCQDLSLAGRGDGIHGARTGLYKEILRIADVIQPRYLFLENVGAIVSRGLGIVLGDLAARGYDAKWTCLAASEVGAPHKRNRWWCLAYPSRGASATRNESPGRQTRANADWRSAWANVADTESQPERAGLCADGPGGLGRGRPGNGCGPSNISNTERDGLQRPQHAQPREGAATIARRPADAPWWSVEPDVGRLAHGLAFRGDQIRALGNGQVPLCAAVAWKILGGP